jgi:hypothetical protein
MNRITTIIYILGQQCVIIRHVDYFECENTFELINIEIQDIVYQVFVVQGILTILRAFL